MPGYLSAFPSLVFAVSVSAGVTWPPATFSPANPTSANPIQATFTVPGGCGIDSSTFVVGAFVRTTVLLFGCGVGPPPFTVDETVVFGPLPANTYTYEIYFDAEFDLPELRSEQTLIVSAAAATDVPALSPIGIAILAIATAIAAVTGLGRSLGQ